MLGAPMHRLSLLVDLASLLTREVGIDALLDIAGERLASAMGAQRATLWLVDASDGSLVSRVAVLPERKDSLRLARGQGIAGHVAESGEMVCVNDVAESELFDASIDASTGFATKSILAAPVRAHAGAPIRGVVQVLNKHDGLFDEEDAKYLAALAVQFEQVLALTTLRADDHEAPGVVLRGPINHIVGRSEVMEGVYETVMLCAETDASVLLRGETGTGKTMLARAIHVNSQRSAGPFVTVDCTTIPGELAASELFGHERGSFTGAERRVLGKVELANEGTLFLDEVGELPLRNQAQLLRFLQERSFERVGGRETLSANVRVCCATHVDLEARVKAGLFREDLYYRIRVVELNVPPLRKRGNEDIVHLAQHFADKYARRYGRPRPVLSERALIGLRAYAWPGNVRELEHWIESRVVLERDGTIDSVPEERSALIPSEAPGPMNAVSLPHGLTLAEASQRYVQASVERHDGVKSQAATSLGVSRNTVARILKGE